LHPGSFVSPEDGIRKASLPASLRVSLLFGVASTREAAMTAKRRALEQLVAHARHSPEFFHALVFDPERALADVPYLERREKGMLVALEPEAVLAGLIGLFVNPAGTVAECGVTCGGGSCT